MNKIYKKIIDWYEKAKGVDKGAIKVSATVAVLFIAVWIIYLYHIADTSRRYKSVMDDFILAQTERESETLSRSFGDAYAIMLYMSRSASRISGDSVKEEIPKALANALKAGDFENIVYVDLDGGVYFSDGSYSRYYDTKKYTETCDQYSDIKVFYNDENILASNGGIGYVAPVVRNGNLEGHIMGTLSFRDIVKDSELRREIVHDEVILDERGHLVCMIRNDNKVVPLNNDESFFDEAQSNMTAEDFTRFVTEYTECVNAEVSGQSLVNSNGEDILYIYYPIDNTVGWTVMNCYPRSVINTRTRTSEIASIMVFSIIVLIMIIAAIQIIRYLSGERKKITELEYLDGLTGAFNRNAFVGRVEEILEENKNLPYYMVCFDILNFRIINETYGHERSDIIIQELAKACGEAFGHNECYGRLTADVFVALTLDDGEENERIRFLEQQVIEKAKDVYINHPIKIKRGRYEITDLKESVNRMIDKANIARKYVNNNSVDLSCKYSEELLEDARKTEEIESQMHEALANGEFKPFLQAKFNMVENHVAGAEALVRWIKPDGKVVPPGDFIPLFERNGFVEKIDLYMLEQICKYIRRMIDENRDVYKVSVNQSRYLLNDPEYVNKVKTILLRYQIPVGLIELELTETVFFHEKDRMIQMMNELKSMNIDLSIDDFGSGYSSFNILKDVPFDVLKIDREFLTDSVHTEKGRTILQKIVDMAHGLGMSVICEGVENTEQIDLLISINCHYAQGFYYARPIPMEEFIEKYNLPKA